MAAAEVGAGGEFKEEGPVLTVISKRLRALKKKLNRISQMEESLTLGKALNKEQEEVLKSKASVLGAIDELEKLRAPIITALADELSHASVPQTPPDQDISPSPNQQNDSSVEDLLNLLYFGSLFDVKSQGEFTATMLTRTHERGCCLTYDYVTDDATDLLGERDLDLISHLGSLLISRPSDSGLSHKNALNRCAEHAKLWLSHSNQPVSPNSNHSYSSLREKLNKIVASDYFTATPEMKVPVEMAAAAVGNFDPFHSEIPLSDPNTCVVEGVEAEEEEEEYDSIEDGSPEKEVEKGGEEVDSNIEVGKKGYQRRGYDSYRGNRGGGGGGGGGRRGYANGRNRGGDRGGFYNGRSHYYEHGEGYGPRGYHGSRGRGRSFY